MDAEPFLTTARAAESLIDSAPVRARWHEPSALDGYDVAGLAGHLARAVLTVASYLDRPAADGERTDAAGYFVQVLGAHDPVTSELHLAVRARSAEEATAGPDALLTRLRAARQALAERLPTTDADAGIAVRDGLVLSVADYLDTRLVELVVHLDDLAVSTDQEPPAEVPPAAYETVAAVLARIAVARAGPLATVRALARRERHPEAVRAF